jgi:hypothetical protein
VNPKQPPKALGLTIRKTLNTEQFKPCKEIVPNSQHGETRGRARRHEFLSVPNRSNSGKPEVDRRAIYFDEMINGRFFEAQVHLARHRLEQAGPAQRTHRARIDGDEADMSWRYWLANDSVKFWPAALGAPCAVSQYETFASARATT